MLEITASVTFKENSSEGADSWVPYELGTLRIDNESLQFGEIKLERKDVVSAILSRHPWPYNRYTLVVNTDEQGFIFNFNNPPLSDLVFPFQVEWITHTPFKQRASKLMWAVVVLLLVLWAGDIWMNQG
jgi:hypothetical protein